ncbi:hypothetical protein JVT61DRAFT_7917 [Boletus reticuloceps]|uniref:PIN domain-containing protein n=1 Tax=Boletus reticuloceps TaxID=495285 RepID=A0A8I2YIW1_9AGAM|nr:hypothetical protein JVT61DRAFT_7917 [Boletus reticuloceps]
MTQNPSQTQPAAPTSHANPPLLTSVSSTTARTTPCASPSSPNHPTDQGPALPQRHPPIMSLPPPLLPQEALSQHLRTWIQDSYNVDENSDESRFLLHARARDVSNEEPEQQKWLKLISDHKQLADMMHNLMEISLAPSVPTSLRVIPTKCIRLWTHAFHRLLEALRHASFASPLALEHLQDFIYFAYTFYTGLLEEPTLKSFRAGWLEALGVARYRMAVAAMITTLGDAYERLRSTTSRELRGEDRRVEIEVLDTEEGDQLTDGIIQDEDADDRGNELTQLWIRITRTAVNLAGLVDGLAWVEGNALDDDICALCLRLLNDSPHPPRFTAPTLNVVPGYSILVLDTNIILSSLSIVASIVESLRWTVVIPVPVIMELDGLCSNTSQLGEAAQEAIAYITSHVRSHAMSLKVQTSKGSYLTTLSILGPMYG